MSVRHTYALLRRGAASGLAYCRHQRLLSCKDSARGFCKRNRHFFQQLNPQQGRQYHQTIEVVAPVQDDINPGSSHEDAAPNSESMTLLSVLQSSESGPAAAVSERVVLGIDPDTKGAISVVRFQLLMTGGAPQWQLQSSVLDIPQRRVEVFHRTRNQIDIPATDALLRQVLPRGVPHFAVVEHPAPTPLSGRFSCWLSGYGYGVLQGLLSSCGTTQLVVSARRWKLDLQLNKLGKEGSRELALKLFPELQRDLRRKKDHGRAEALLLSAWGLGLRLDKNMQCYLAPSSVMAQSEAASVADDEMELLTDEAG